MEISISPFRATRAATNAQKYIREIRALTTELPNGKSKAQLENLCTLHDHLEKKPVPIDAVTEVFDFITSSICSSNHKICIQGLKCAKMLAMQTLQKNRIGSLLPALANTVVEQWSDTKEVVRLEALDCALVISRMSASAKFNLFLQASKSPLWRTRLVSLSFFKHLVEECGANMGDANVQKSIRSCGDLLSDKHPETRQKAVEVLGVVYSFVGSHIWDKKCLGGLNCAKSILENLKSHLSTIVPKAAATNNYIQNDLENISKQRKMKQTKVRSKSKSRKGLSTLSNSVNNIVEPTEVMERAGSNNRPIRFASSPTKGRKGASNDMGAEIPQGGKREDIIPLKMKDKEELIKTVSKIETILADKLGNWKSRNKALILLQKIIAHPGLKNIPAYETQLYRLAEALSVQLTELRSTVVRQVCLTLKVISEHMRENLGVIGERCVPVLLSLTGNRIGIISKSANSCIRTIIKSWEGGSAVILHSIVDASGPKCDKVTRARCQQYFLDALQLWPKRCFKKDYSKFSELIFRSITDRSDKVRYLARKSFWAFVAHFPRAQDHIASRLSSSDQERLFAEKVNISGMANMTNEEEILNNLETQRQISNDPDEVKHNLFHSKAEAENIGIKNRLEYAQSILAGPADTSIRNQSSFIRVTEIRDHSAITRNKHKASKIQTDGRMAACENYSQWNEKPSIVEALENRPGQQHIRAEETKLPTSSAMRRHHGAIQGSASSTSYLNRHLQNKFVPDDSGFQDGTNTQTNNRNVSTCNSILKKLFEKVNDTLAMFESSLWSTRIRAIDEASTMIDKALDYAKCHHSQSINIQVCDFMDTLCKAFSNKLPDSHHRVTVKVLTFLSANVVKSSLSDPLMKNMSRILPCIFDCLAAKREDVKNTANEVLNKLLVNFDKNVLARALCCTLAQRTWESKLAYQDFLYHIIPAAAQTFKIPNLLRQIFKKICINLKIRNSKLAISCSNVLCALYKCNTNAFLSQVTLMELGDRNAIVESMKNSLLDINDKLKRFVRSSSYIKGPKNVQEDNEVVSTRNPSYTFNKDEQFQKTVSSVTSTPLSPSLYNKDLTDLSGQSVVGKTGVKVFNTLRQILLAAMSKSPNSRCDALASIAKISKGHHLKWGNVHSQLVNVILNALSDDDMTVQLSACDSLRCILAERTAYMSNMLDIVVFRLIDAVETSVMEIQNALRGTLESMVKIFKPSNILKSLLPMLNTLNGYQLQIVLHQICKIISRLATGTLLDALPEIMPQVIHAMEHEEASIRKEAVFCFVEAYFALGENVMPYFEQLSIAQRKLLTIYVKKRKKNITEV